jgi:hypothetical protein
MCCCAAGTFSQTLVSRDLTVYRPHHYDAKDIEMHEALEI